MAEPTPEPRVSVFDPSTAQYGTVPASELQQAVRAGMVPESAEQTAARYERDQYDTLGEGLRAGAEGVARGATLGLSDVGATALGLATPEDMARRQRLSPILSGVGEVAGAAAPLLLSGGAAAPAEAGLAGRAALGLGRVATAPAGLALRAGQAAEAGAGALLRGAGLTGESALGRAALSAGRFAAGGAAEGAIFGAGQALSEEALSGGDYSRLGEHMLAGAESGGMFGALAAGSIGGAIGLAGAGVEKLGGALRRRLTLSEEAANEQALKALGARGTDIRALRTDAKVQQVGADLRKLKLADGTEIIGAGETAEQIAAKVKIARAEKGAELGRMRDSVAATGDAVDVSGYLKRVDAEVLRPLRTSPSPTLRARAGAVEEELASLRMRNDSFQASQSGTADFARRVDSELLAGMAESKSLGVRKMTAALREQVNKVAELAASGQATTDIVLGLKNDVLARLSSAPSATIRRGAKLFGKEADTLARGMSKPVTFDELLAQQGALKEIVYPKKAPGMGLPAAPPAHAEALARAERLLEDTTEAHVEKTLQRIDPEQAGRYRQLRRENESLIKADTLSQKITKQNLGNRNISPSDYGTGLAIAAGQLASGNVLGLVHGAAAAIAHKIVRERGNSFLVALAGRQAKIDTAITHAVERFVNGATAVRRVAVGELSEGAAERGLEKRSAESKLKAFGELVSQVQSATVPGRMVADVEAPNAGQAARVTATRAIAFLQSKVPATASAGRNPLYPKLQTHPSEIDKFNRYYQAINEPLSVLEGLNSGQLSRESVEALATVYPRIYEQVQTKASEVLSRREDPLPYSKRMLLGQLLGIPTDPGLEPGAIATAQEALTSQAGTAAPPPPNIPPAKSIAKMFPSEATRLESQELAI